jgi:glutamyl/glutaminyl-tRNA synthetase
MNNYLSLLGWSHPEEKDIFDMEEIISVFDINRFSKSPAVFDLDKFRFINAQHLRKLAPEVLVGEFCKYIRKDNPFHFQSFDWQRRATNLFKDKIEFFSEANAHFDELFSEDISMTDDLKEILSWSTTPQIKDYLLTQIETLIHSKHDFATCEMYEGWANHVKSELKIKGKNLFQGMRGVLTGRAHGAELKDLIPLTPLKVLEARLRK